MDRMSVKDQNVHDKKLYGVDTHDLQRIGYFYKCGKCHDGNVKSRFKTYQYGGTWKSFVEVRREEVTLFKENFFNLICIVIIWVIAGDM